MSSQVWKLRFGEDIRRFRPEVPIDTYDKLRELVQKLFLFTEPVDLFFKAGEPDLEIQLTPDLFPIVWTTIRTFAVINITIQPRGAAPVAAFPSVPATAAPHPHPHPHSPHLHHYHPSPSPHASPSPSSPSSPSVRIPSSMLPPPSSPVRTPASEAAKTPPGWTVIGPGGKKATGPEVPLKWRTIIWNMQDEFPEATESRVLTTLIKFGGRVAEVREQLRELSRTRVLIRDTGRRGRPKRSPAPSLFFPRGFQNKVKTLMELGFPMERVIDCLISNGGSATQASLQLMDTAAIPPSRDGAADYHRRAVEASVMARQARPDTEVLDPPLTMDQRVVDSLLLLERIHGFDRTQIYRAAESLARPRTPATEIKDQIVGSIPPETMDALATLSRMGFTDTVNNIVLLNKHKGNVTQVVDELTRASRPTWF